MNTIEQATAPGKAARPAGVGFIAGMNMIIGVATLIGVFTHRFSSNEAGIWLIAGLFSIVVGGGLLGLQRWALFLAKAGYILNALAGLVGQNPIAFIVPALILYYLSTDQVRVAFAPPALPMLPQGTEAKEV